MDSMDGDVAAEQRAHDKPLRRAEGDHHHVDDDLTGGEQIAESS
jgi:hypothetical protein